MTVLPLVARELQAEAHRSFTYWSRVVAGGLVAATFAVGSLQLPVGPSQFGPFLFHSLNTAVSVAIYLLVPVLTADCISREKREGTLGLLFLTPLRPGDILAGKALIHGLRALTILLAALPLLGLPLMLGGVRWQWAVYASMSHLSSLLLAVAAGLIASVRNSEWIRALIAAELLSGLFALVFTGLSYLVWGLGLGKLLMAAGFFLWLLQALAAQLKQSWQKDLTSPPQPEWVKIFSQSEFWRSLFRWNKSRTLDRNPIAWLRRPLRLLVDDAVCAHRAELVLGCVWDFDVPVFASDRLALLNPADELLGGVPRYGRVRVVAGWIWAKPFSIIVPSSW
jgi:ABC-type transport system involved in multi-copper enzyme maturation permease subunit